MKYIYRLKKILSIVLVFAILISGINIVDFTVQAAQTVNYKVTCNAGVKLRKDHSTSSSSLGSMAKGTTFTVTEKYKSGGYYWGKTTYNGKTGWTALLKTDHSEIYSTVSGTFYSTLHAWISEDGTSGNMANQPYYAGTKYYAWGELTDPLFK